MKKFFKVLVCLLCVSILAIPVLLSACNGSKDEHVDYAGKVQLDFTTNTKKQEVVVRLFVDGDTTHFDPVAKSTYPGCNNAADFSSDKAPKTTIGYAKARYIAINTPESTGQIEPWGSKASEFTKSKLKTAEKIIIESDDNEWHIDNTGERYVLWIWYIPQGGTEFRNLNIEILQEGLAYASSVDENRYGEYARAAINQAEAEKLYVFSGEKDPDYYYGDAIPVDLRELRFNGEVYANKKVVVEGIVVADFSNSAYIQETYYDIEGYEETGITFGMPVFYAYTTGKVLEILSVGNKVKVVGVVKYYETGGYYQITDIKAYNRYNPDDPSNCQIIEEGVGVDKAFTEIKPADFVSDEANVSVEVTKKNEAGEKYDEIVSLTYKEAILGTSVTISNLTVTRVTTTNNGGSSDGAMTLYCRAADGTEISVRTEVFKDADGNLITKDDYLNKTITVKGIVEYFSIAENYQIKCHRPDYITVVG